MKKFNREREECVNILSKIKCDHILVLNLRYNKVEKLYKNEIILLINTYVILCHYDHEKTKLSSYLVTNTILRNNTKYEIQYHESYIDIDSCNENFINSMIEKKWSDFFEKV